MSITLQSQNVEERIAGFRVRVEKMSDAQLLEMGRTLLFLTKNQDRKHESVRGMAL